MSKIVALAGLSIALGCSAAAAQELPGWPTNAACGPGDNWCTRYEARARAGVAGVWPTLPPEIRQRCVADTEGIEKSYRLLYDCLANAMQLYITNQARNPEGGEVIQLTPRAQTPEPETTAPAAGASPVNDQPAQATTPPRASQPSPPLATEPAPPAAPDSAPPPAGANPTPPSETKQPPQTELNPPAAGQTSPPSPAEPSPPTATNPTPEGTRPTPTR